MCRISAATGGFADLSRVGVLCRLAKPLTGLQKMVLSQRCLNREVGHAVASDQPRGVAADKMNAMGV